MIKHDYDTVSKSGIQFIFIIKTPKKYVFLQIRCSALPYNHWTFKHNSILQNSNAECGASSGGRSSAGLLHGTVIEDLAFAGLNKTFCLPVKIKDWASKGFDRAL